MNAFNITVGNTTSIFSALIRKSGGLRRPWRKHRDPLNREIKQESTTAYGLPPVRIVCV